MDILCGGQPVRLQPRLAGAGLLLGAILEVLRAPGINWAQEDGALALTFNQWTAATLSILSIAWVALWAVGVSGKTDVSQGGPIVRLAHMVREATASRATTGLAATTVVLLAGCYVTGAPLLDAPLSLGSMAVTGAAFAVGIAVCALLWFRVYARLGAGSALAHGGLAIAAAGIVRFIMAGHDAVTILLVFAACCLGSYGCITPSLPAEEAAEPESAGNPAGWRQAAQDAAPVLWLPLAAACIVGFIQALSGIPWYLRRPSQDLSISKGSSYPWAASSPPSPLSSPCESPSRNPKASVSPFWDSPLSWASCCSTLPLSPQAASPAIC